jgi:hypothetical protein
MAKRIGSRKTRILSVRPRRRAVSRYEVDGLRLRLDNAETQLSEHRNALDIQFRRIAQLQVEVSSLRRAQGPVPAALAQPAENAPSTSPAAPSGATARPGTTTVES